MNRVLFSDLRAGRHNRSVRVRVSRLCHHHGGLEDGEIKEIRMVLLDEDGTSVYAIVPRSFVDQNIYGIDETGVYDISSFKVVTREVFLNLVENPMVIMFRESTVVQVILHPTDEFPEWTYRLTSFTDLPTPGYDTRKLVDVLGVIRGISNSTSLAMPDTNVQVIRRNLLLADGSGNEIKVTLWGEAALRFNAKVIRFLAKDESAVVIFVGMNVYISEGLKELTGTSACRWYINVDIEDINILRALVQPSFQPIVQLPVPVQVNLRIPIHGRYPTRPLSLILDTDFYENQHAMFRCTVKVSGLMPGQQWWGMSCTRCGDTAIPVSASSSQGLVRYTCSRVDCDNTDTILEYRLRLLCSDNTDEAEFTLSGRLADDIVGISVQDLIRCNSQGNMKAGNLAFAASHILHMPTELSALTSWKYKFLFRVSIDSFRGRWASFHVLGVETCCPPDLI